MESAQLNIVIYNEDNSIFLNNPIIITNEEVIVVTIYIVNITENKIWKTRMSLSLQSGAVIDVTGSTILSKYIINDLQIFSHSLGTYDITEATLYSDLSNIGRTCYSCHFIRGAIVKGCLISLISSTYSTKISLMCSPVCSSTVIGCTYDIPTGIYNMYVYDIEEEGTLSDDWAISSSNITIIGLEPTDTSLKMTSPVSHYVSMVTVFSTTCPVLTSPVSMVTTRSCDCMTISTFVIDISMYVI